MNDSPGFLESNSIALLDGERMIRGLEFDERSSAVRAEVGHGFEVDGIVGVVIDFRAQPAEEGANLNAFIKVLTI